MSKFTKGTNIDKFSKLVDEVRYMDPVDVLNGYVYGEQASEQLHYTLVIEPEIEIEDGETFITLNLGVLANNGRMSYLDNEYSSVELGYYNDNAIDKATVFKAFTKLMKAASEYGLYVTELVDRA